MATVMLPYFEKLYPDSYKIWHILGKCSQAATLYLNHKLIDKIKISKNLESYDEDDYELIKNCDIVINTRPNHDDIYWYNKRNCVSETLKMAGINLNHLNFLLTEEEKRPKLEKWFNVGLFDENSVGYCKENYKISEKTKNIAIKPFPGYNGGGKRSLSEKWWKEMVESLLKEGYEVRHYGYVTEPILSNNSDYKRLVNLSFFDQVRAALDSKLCILDDSGFSWAIGAYSHKSIHLLTNWQNGHNDNFLAFAPININSINIFKQNDINLIEKEEILEKIKLII